MVVRRMFPLLLLRVAVADIFHTVYCFYCGEFMFSFTSFHRHRHNSYLNRLAFSKCKKSGSYSLCAVASRESKAALRQRYATAELCENTISLAVRGSARRHRVPRWPATAVLHFSVLAMFPVKRFVSNFYISIALLCEKMQGKPRLVYFERETDGKNPICKQRISHNPSIQNRIAQSRGECANEIHNENKVTQKSAF